MIEIPDPEYAVGLEDATRAAQEMFVFANGLAEDRLVRPQHDLMSAILHGEVGGQRLNTMEFDSFFLLLALAGPVSYLRSNLIDGVKHIPLKFRAA